MTSNNDVSLVLTAIGDDRPGADVQAGHRRRFADDVLVQACHDA